MQKHLLPTAVLDRPIPGWNGLFLVWLCFAAITTALLAIFVPVRSAFLVGTLLSLPALVFGWELWRFDRILIVLMLVLANFFRLNKILAVQLPNGDNLFGVRDLLIVMLVVVGLVKGWGRLREVAHHPLLWPGLLITAMLPFAAILGLMHSGDILLIVRECFAIGGWLIAWVVAANLRDEKSLRQLIELAILLGSLISIGSFVEILSGNRLQVVSSYQTALFEGSESLGRNFPDGYIFMIIAWLAAATMVLAGYTLRRWVLTFLVVGMSCVLTQMRTVLISFVLTSAVVILVAFRSRPPWLKIRRMAMALALIGLSIMIAALSVTRIADSELVSQAVERYGRLYEDSAARIYELQSVAEDFKVHPLTGLGLGVRYRDDLPFWENDTGTLVHNIIGYYQLKLGLLGLFCFLFFCWQVFGTLKKFLKKAPVTNMNLLGLGLSTALLAIIIAAQSANVFGDIRQMPIVAIAVGLLVGVDRLANPPSAQIT